MSTRPLTALLLSDGKPGHYHQAEGVIAAMARMRPVETARLQVRRRFAVPSRTLLQLVNGGASPALVLRLGYRIKTDSIPDADVVVSGGGDTLAANAAIAKTQGVPNIFCGRLRRLAPEHMRLVIIPLQRMALAPNYLVSLPPSAIDPGPLRRAGTGHAAAYGRGNPPARVGVLIGGNSGSLHYGSEDWLLLIAFLRDAHRKHGIRWLATTSRRSGSFIGDALAALATEPDSGIETFVDFRTAGAGMLPSVFAAADAILCTDDSTAMISEAVGACLPVVSVVPAAATPEVGEAEFRQQLAARGWYRPLPLSRLTPEAFLAALEEIEPCTSNQLDELAAALQARLPELFSRP